MFDPVELEIPDHIKKELERVRRSHHHNEKQFEKWHDDLLKAYWKHPDYRQHDLANLIGYSYNTCKRRYEELVGKE